MLHNRHHHQHRLRRDFRTVFDGEDRRFNLGDGMVTISHGNILPLTAALRAWSVSKGTQVRIWAEVLRAGDDEGGTASGSILFMLCKYERCQPGAVAALMIWLITNICLPEV